MAFNIAQVGVDKKSGAPIIQRSSTFTYNNDPNGTSDIFYYFGSRLRSSSFVNPSSTQFLNASRLNAGTISGPGDNAVDNSILTNLFAASTDATDGIQVEFSTSPFTLNSLQLNSNTLAWVLEASNDGNNWTNIALGSSQNIGSNWSLISIPNATSYSFYRLLHGENGVSKDLVALKFFGTYQNGDIAPAIDNEAQFLATHRNGPGKIYLPDASVELFPENYYCTFLHFKTGDYTYEQFAGGTTVVNDNTNGTLRQGEQLLAVFDNGAWELFKVGSGTDVGFKGALLTSDGIQSTVLPAGSNGQYLKADSISNEGITWDTLNLSDIATPTSNFDMGGQKITNAGEGTAPSDYITKSYADSIAAGFDPKQSCELATTQDLSTETSLTWTASGSGVSKTLTSNGSTAIVDSVSLQNGFRILVKNEVNLVNNGIYLVSGVGSTIVLTRSTDFDEDVEVTPGAFTFITQGNTNISTGHILLGASSLVVDTDDLVFTQFVGAGALSISSLADTNIGNPSIVDNNKFIGWNNSTGFFELLQSPGTQIGNLLLLEDVSSNPGLPSVDGTQLSLNSSQVSPLTSKGDIWTYDTTDGRLPVGTDNQLLVSASGESTGLKWKTISSIDFNIGSTATDLTINFKTGTDRIELGPLYVDDSLTPSANEFLRYDGDKFIAVDPTGVSIGDIVVLEDVGGNSGLPAIDGSQLTNVNVAQGQGSPLNTKGDIYIFDTANSRLPAGLDGQVLLTDSSTNEGLSWGELNLNLTNLSSYTEIAGSTTYTKVSDLDTNDLIYAFGTNFGTETFTTPEPSIYLQSNLSNTTRIIDRTVTNSLAIATTGIVLDLKFNSVYKPGVISLFSNTNSTLTWVFEGSNDNSNWDLLLSEQRQIASWEDFDLNSTVFYRYVRISSSSVSGAFIQQIQLYGDYINSILPTAQLNELDSKGKITLLSFPSQSIWNLPGLVSTDFYTFYKNISPEKVELVLLDNNDTIQGETSIYPQQGGLLIKSDNNTWLNIKDPNLLNTKGQLLAFDTKPTVLQPGTSGQVLVANESSELGFRWENRARADDLIYTKEIPFDTLSHTVNDIFEYVGRDNDITFSNTFTNPSDGTRVIATTNTTFTSTRADLISLTDQSNSASSLQLQSGGYAEWHFQSVTIQLYSIAVYSQSNNADTDWVVQVSNDGTNWINVGTLLLDGSLDNNWVIGSTDVNGYYSYIRVLNSGVNSDVWVNEVKLFGWVKNNPQLGELFVVGSTGIVPLALGPDNYVLIADSNEPNGVKWDIVNTVINANSHTSITTNEEVLSSTKTLLSTDASFQLLDPDGQVREVQLPDPPQKDLYFKIVNADSNFSLNIKETSVGSIIKTLDIDTPYVECHYTGTQWIILD